MSPALTRRGVIQAGAAVVAATVLTCATAHATPVVFDPEAFVDDLLKAGCRVSVHHPIGRDAGPPFVWIAPAGIDGAPTTGEREVRAKWAAAMAACPDARDRVLAVCQRRAGARP